MYGAYAIILVMFMERFNAFVEGRENKIIAILGGICGLSVVVIAICLIVQALGNVTGTYLSLNIAPSSAKITIDGKDYRNGVWEFPSGQYNAVISADGFESKTISFKVGGGTTTIYEYIVNKDEGMSWFETDLWSLKLLRHIEDSTAKEFIAKYDKKLGIKDILPLDYYVDPHNELEHDSIYLSDASRTGKCRRVFCLQAKYDDPQSSGNEVHLKQIFKDAGYAMEDYEIIEQ